MQRLGEVLDTAEALNWQHALYLPLSEAWNEASRCAVLDPTDGEEVDDALLFAKKHGLEYVLGISAVQDIVANARMQIPIIDISDLMKAFLFYYDHDAFIVFS